MDEVANFLSFNLDSRILDTLNEIGFETPTPIQELAIPAIINGSDLIASAKTGTGKTAAFMLPILNFLSGEEGRSSGFRGPRILVLVPTRELAIQVSDEAKRFSKHLPHIKTVCIYGGVPYPLQKRFLSKRYDILVATPGRLLDHMNQKRIDLSGLNLLVLDEADRMLDMGFADDVLRIVDASPKSRQTLLFSATIDKKILPLSKKLQNNPVEIKTNTEEFSPSKIDHALYYVDNIDHKNRLLEKILESPEIEQAIIFTSTKHQADVLSRQLKELGHSSSALHGDMNQPQRTRTIDKMRRGAISMLVATDVAARGIDITTISHVFNFDLPRNPEDFIHRIGRTGRAGASGKAISFATYTEDHLLNKIARLMGVPMQSHTITGLEPRPKKSGPKMPFKGKPRFGDNRFRSRKPFRGKPNFAKNKRKDTRA